MKIVAMPTTKPNFKASCLKHEKSFNGDCTHGCKSSQQDKFEKISKTDNSLKTRLPLALAAGAAIATMVGLADALVSKISKGKADFVKIGAFALGIGVAKGIINGTISNILSKEAKQNDDLQSIDK